MKQWYYVQNSQQVGPIPEHQLIAMLNSGQLDHGTLVWTNGLQNWIPAADAGGLILSHATPPIPPIVTSSTAGEISKRSVTIERIKTLSHVVDLTIFFILIFAFDVGFLVALVISVGVGWLIRLIFCRNK
jgi:hypothetical protein